MKFPDAPRREYFLLRVCRKGTTSLPYNLHIVCVLLVVDKPSFHALGRLAFHLRGRPSRTLDDLASSVGAGPARLRSAEHRWLGALAGDFREVFVRLCVQMMVLMSTRTRVGFVAAL